MNTLDNEARGSGQVTEQVSYKNITATVRPPRCAILINKNSKYWKTAVQGLISQASQVWGGRYFLIVPTDGQSIDDKFWEILEGYSPDYLAVYNVTFSDLEQAEPATYKRARQQYEEGWKKQGFAEDQFEEWFTGSAAGSFVDELTLSSDLEQELLYRLSPFHFEKPIDQYLNSRSGFGYPFVKITEIISTATRHIGQVVLPKMLEDPTLSLLIYSQTGLDSEGYVTELNAEHFSTQRLPEQYDTIDFLRRAFGASPSLYPLSADHGIRNDYMSAVPYALSMLHLGQYYRLDRHIEYKEPITVILGDTVDDFCLYFSLSRVHEEVYWLPLAWLRKAHRNGRLYKDGGVHAEIDDDERAALTLVNLFFERVQYGRSDKYIQLTSMSLSLRQLAAYKPQMAQRVVGGADRFKSVLRSTPVQSVSTSCMFLVFEQDNYVNYRDMVFVDNKSVSFLDTPRPKNFSEIKLPGHYWMTSITIDGYGPPSLSTLGPKIINILGSTTDSRVAVDGIVYLCPNSMIFSSDLDATLRRPKIEMPDTMALFGEYFQPAGVRVKYSDKGNYFLDTLRRFGGLDAAGAFIKAQPTRRVLEKFMSRSVGEKGDIIYLDNDQRAYLNLGAITTSLGDEKAAVSLIDELIGKEVLQRGYILQCERCRLISWYSVDVLTAEFVCNRCGLHQQFTSWHWRNPAQPHWYYRLAETVYQFYVNNSHLVAQVLYKLKMESKGTFHFAPEIDLINFPKKGKSREMDVACIVDGQIVFGECKTEPLKPEDVDKFDTLLGMPIKNPGRIIFATTKNVPDDFKKRMSALPRAEAFTREMLYDD